jgi:nitroreductase
MSGLPGTCPREPSMRDVLELIRERHSARMPFDPAHRVTGHELRRILEAARWAPTAHNMQNFEVLVVDDPATLGAIGALRREISRTFLRENYQQLSFSEEELLRRKTGVLASMFPPEWRTPGAEPGAQPALLRDSLQDCAALLLVLYDPRTRAPASAGDVLGIMSLGCVMQNMWLAAADLGLGFQVLSTFSADAVERELKPLLALPRHLRIALACRLGHPAGPARRYLRVRRDVREFAHHNRYGDPLPIEDEACAATASTRGTAGQSP